MPDTIAIIPTTLRAELRAALSEGRSLTGAEARALIPWLAGAPREAAALLREARENRAARDARENRKTGQRAVPRPAPFSCGIINAKSGRCGEDCAFCAQSRYHDTGTPVYPLLSAESLLERARLLSEHGVTRMGVVTSGTAPTGADLEKICAAARMIRERFPIALCASLGLLDAEKAARLRDAGFTSYHHNLETARSFYPSICGTHAYERRVETVRAARAAGLRVCSGALFGLGEGWEERIELSLTLRELDVDSIPVNFLMPVPGTRLGGRKPLGAEEGLAVVALLRLMHPEKDIVLCGGRNTTLGERDTEAFPGGANGIMVGDYLTEKGSPFARDMELLVSCGAQAAREIAREAAPEPRREAAHA